MQGHTMTVKRAYMRSASVEQEASTYRYEIGKRGPGPSTEAGERPAKF